MFDPTSALIPGVDLVPAVDVEAEVDPQSGPLTSRQRFEAQRARTRAARTEDATRSWISKDAGGAHASL